jgi:ketosteroid isomerase-like protein
MRPGLIALTVVACGCFPGSVLAQESPSLLEIAESYLDALYSSDFGTLRALLAPDATFRDPTGEALAGAEINYQGRDTIISAFEASMVTLRHASFEVHSAFDSGQHVVLNLTYRFEVNGDAFGHPGAWIPIEIPAVTILRIVNGKVQEHLDHADYDEFTRQVEGFIRGSQSSMINFTRNGGNPDG